MRYIPETGWVIHDTPGENTPLATYCFFSLFSSDLDGPAVGLGGRNTPWRRQMKTTTRTIFNILRSDPAHHGDRLRL